MATFAENASGLHHALANHDHAGIIAHLADDAVLHQDNTTPVNMGVEADRATLSERWDKVTVGSSELLAQATNEEAKASFVLAHFKDCAQKDCPDGDVGNAVCLWHATWTPNGSKVKELVVVGGPYTHVKLQDEKATPFDPATFSRPKTGGALDRADTTKVEAAMKAFCGMYDDANPDAVPDVLSEDFYEWRPTNGATKSGRQAVADSLKQHGQMWKQVNSALAVAAADASSGFLAWAALGRMPGKDGAVNEAADPMMFTGLCYALLGPDGKVSKSLHLALNEPKSVLMHWTGFSRGSG